ncbi:hypothetical protein A6U87_14720 [Rhizobium sp. AC44/96]|uniref:phage terminase small subunit P27 family n=1 Tax=Rhizobium sp. AC44/96 TaxID=1841654 RepID=UPI00080FEB60|nr:phage terminase small subunit P27 family [Rhizobium sp. AC44/96]OCJ05258.1 hypothetical protein A6U87_14720 [Rhizobium sp. AC44/96]
MAHHGVKPALKAIPGGLDGIPPLPAGVDPSMADEWQAIAFDLKERKLLARPVLGSLETYVTALWNVRECQAAIKEHGLLVGTAHGMKKPNPACGLLHKQQAVVARFAAELGLTPASRSRAGMGGDAPTKPEDDPLGLD